MSRALKVQYNLAVGMPAVELVDLPEGATETLDDLAARYARVMQDETGAFRVDVGGRGTLLVSARHVVSIDLEVLGDV